MADLVLEDFRRASVIGSRLENIQGKDCIIADLDCCNKKSYQVYLRDCDIYRKVKKSFDEFCAIMISWGWGTKLKGLKMVDGKNSYIIWSE